MAVQHVEIVVRVYKDRFMEATEFISKPESKVVDEKDIRALLKDVKDLLVSEL